jgi:hypothetical protein
MNFGISIRSHGYNSSINETDEEYGSAFFLTCSIFQGPWGKMYKLFNLKWTVLGALVVFEIGSVICGTHIL